MTRFANFCKLFRLKQYLVFNKARKEVRNPMKKQNKTTQKPIKKFKKVYVPEKQLWGAVTIVLLLMTLFWHIQNTVGWLNGTIMTDLYGIDANLANAISQCPDILFYTTHITLAISLVMLGVTGWVLYRYVVEEMDSHKALNITAICAMVTVWIFPITHAFADLTATAMVVRDTSGFDVFQLGIDAGPMVVISAVCAVVLWVNKRASAVMK